MIQILSLEKRNKLKAFALLSKNRPSINDIAKTVGCSHSTVKNYLKIFNAPPIKTKKLTIMQNAILQDFYLNKSDISIKNAAIKAKCSTSTVSNYYRIFRETLNNIK